MAGVAAVGIDDDLSSGKSRIARRAADDESAGRIDEELRLLREETRLREIIARELGVEPRDVRKGHSDSYMVCGKVK